jgi:hypothetical protein
MSGFLMQFRQISMRHLSAMLRRPYGEMKNAGRFSFNCDLPECPSKRV